MPGPGLDLIGAEEPTEVAEALPSRRGAVDPDLAPFGVGLRDDADTAQERAGRFRDVAARFPA